MKYRHDLLNVPVSLCIYALKNRLIGQLSLYLYLKMKSDGTVFKPESLRSEYCKVSTYSVWSFDRHLNWLIKNKWIYKTDLDKYTVLSFNKLLRERKIECRTNRGAIFNPSDLQDLKSFISAAVITYYARLKHFLNRNSVGVKIARANRGRVSSLLDLPHAYLAK